ncbi:alginate lyase [Niabella ginsenosidivorans]|uniref:Alginate lyase n=1 Tax=Niabella ginsenosidivorans TaxID=1176587 RepID=A0A1A9I5B4_9BACT|nr:polysaccharide lyase 6 family protein [Niabella ginsenosidivorans]ANH82877.1 alginate lyase [Niabella ginsenosidivorans]
MMHFRIVICLLAFLFTGLYVKAKTYPVNNAAEINRLVLLPGDTVLMLGTSWKDAQINFKGTGTEAKPVVLMAGQPGKLILSGNSNLKIDGHWLVVNGLYFTNGYSLNDDVIIFSKTASHCRLTNTAIVNYNPPDKKTDYKWVSLYGSYNSVDHCELTGKEHQGTTLVVWLSDTPNHHIIQNNYFGPRPPLGANGGESIRIGTSEWSMHDSYTLVQQNIFDRCDGEIEVISVKSCHNRIGENLFYECDGTVTLRHGNDNTVDSNYFIGNDQPNTGGIRIIGERHTVAGNYLYKTTGTDLRAAISIMNTFKDPKLNEYWQVKDAVIENNYIIHCKNAFVIGAGKNDKRTVAPESITIKNNYIVMPQLLLDKKEKPLNSLITGNKVLGTPGMDGFTTVKNKSLQINKYGIWVLPENKRIPFWLRTTVGPQWKKALPVFTIRSGK